MKTSTVIYHVPLPRLLPRDDSIYELNLPKIEVHPGMDLSCLGAGGGGRTICAGGFRARAWFSLLIMPKRFPGSNAIERNLFFQFLKLRTGARGKQTLWKNWFGTHIEHVASIVININIWTRLREHEEGKNFLISFYFREKREGGGGKARLLWNAVMRIPLEFPQQTRRCFIYP